MNTVMKNLMNKILLILMIFCSKYSLSQDKVKLLNKGNEFYQNNEFEKSEYYYKKALEKDNKYYKANINIGHSLFKQAQSLIENGNDTIGIDKLKESEAFYSNSIELTKNKKEKAIGYYNLGNSQLLSNQIDKSIESYKNSLRNEPNNLEAKHNLALAQSLQNQQQQQQQQQNQQQQQQNQQQQQQDNQKEEKKDNNTNDENSNNTKKENLSKEEINQILNALKRQEQEVQKDLEKKKINGKNKPLKDW